jgi:uncharacterized surface protein with fasciclin (FAS1) repeats
MGNTGPRISIIVAVGRNGVIHDIDSVILPPAK